MFLEKLDHQAILDPQIKSLLKMSTSCLLLKSHMIFNSLLCPLHTHTPHTHTHTAHTHTHHTHTLHTHTYHTHTHHTHTHPTHTSVYVTHLHSGNTHKQPLSPAQFIFVSYLPGACRHLSLSIIPCTFISLSCNVQYFGPVWCSLPCQGYFFAVYRQHGQLSFSLVLHRYNNQITLCILMVNNLSI